ncbi:MAG TPA: YncE family protein [Planctomycetota bacterium]|nr:YncE family protein [Planctomycetota bacterium]
MKRFHASRLAAPTAFPRPFVAALLALLAVPLAAQTPHPGNVPATPSVDQSALHGTNPGTQTGLPNQNFFDNTKGNLVRHQLGHIQPIAVSGNFLFAPNNAGQRLAKVDLSNNSLVFEIPTGPGITSLAIHPITGEVWAVDSVNGCVSVIDPNLPCIMRTIQVGKEPHGIAILDDGSRAYVTCSASNWVDVIDCATYLTGRSIPIPARAPRGIAIDANGMVWVAPLFSGNNTTAKKTTPNIAPIGVFSSQQVITPTSPANPLDDEDLFAIDSATDRLVKNQTRRGLGTILLNVHARPNSTELWIPNTDALNLTIGANNFVNGQVVKNRITIVDTSSPPSSLPTVIELDAIGAGQPAAVAFDATRNRAYVAAFGSDAIIVLDTAASPPTYVGIYDVLPLTPPMPVAPFTPARCGPRGLVMSPSGNDLFVFNGIDNSYSRVNLAVTPATVSTHTLGYDPTPHAIKRGIGHLANARHSGSATSSCMSCHVDGHFDMITWNLSGFSDPQGTTNPDHDIDNKGPMTTQSLRGLFEAGRLHWRGEQASLKDFNEDGFAGLLKGSLLLDKEFDEVKAATFSLVYPANPRAPADRIYTTPSSHLHGLELFRNHDAVAGQACATCHTLPLGTSNQIQLLIASGDPSRGGKVAQLRGVGDKLFSWNVTPAFPTFKTVFDGNYAVNVSDVVDRTPNGWGLTHAGTVATLSRFVHEFPGSHPVIPDPTLIPDVVAFAEAFDTGLAPATTFQRTLVPGIGPGYDQRLDFDNTLQFLTGQANAGNCDIVVATQNNNMVYTFAWDHEMHLWQTQFATLAVTDDQLGDNLFDAGMIVTFFGMPLGTGRRFGVDRDFDDLLDLDEGIWTPFSFADVVNPDSDGDTLPDGYEVRFYPSLNPRVPNSSWSNPTLPNITHPVRVVYYTATTAKIEFSTDQPTSAELTGLTGTVEATKSPPNGRYDYNHSIHVRGLTPATTYSLTLEVRTPSPAPGGVLSVTAAPGTWQFTTSGQMDSVRVREIAVSPLPPALPTTVNVTIEAHLNATSHPTPPVPLGTHDVTAFWYFGLLNQPASLTPITFGSAGTTQNVASFGLGSIPQSVLQGQQGQRVLYFGVKDITWPVPPPPDAQFYFEAFDLVNFEKFLF